MYKALIENLLNYNHNCKNISNELNRIYRYKVGASLKHILKNFHLITGLKERGDPGLKK